VDNSNYHYTNKHPVFWEHAKRNLPKVCRNEKYIDENLLKIMK
jgi:sensor domain CHASE-containing protein